MSDTSRSAWIHVSSIECHNKANTVRDDRTQQEGDHGLICVAPLRQVLNVFFVSNGGEIYFQIM